MSNKLRIIAFIVAIIVFAVGVIMATAESKKIENLKESYYNVTASSELKQSGEHTHALGCYPVYSICINKEARR